MIGHAMRFRGLVPYAAVALLVAVGSSYAAVSAARPAEPLAPSATASGTLAPRAAPELSKTGRLAFWRENRLWVSSLDGSLRRSVTSTADMRRVSLTRWALDGRAVAFVDAGLSLVVVATDGARVDVDVPIELRNAGYRIADIRWSPDATRIAATLLRPGDGRSDAFLVDLTAERLAWKRLTTLEDLFVGDWVSADELLASTALGAVGVLGTRSTNAMRLISGVQGVSPILGPDGRIHFLVGRVPTSRDPSLAWITASRASVWSAALNGTDIRREATWELSDIRLDARLPDGRYLAHRGTSNSQGTVSEDLELLPTDAGVIERVRLAPDGKVAYGFTPERVVRIDLAKLSAKPPVAQTAAVSVFLETGGDADVWFPPKLLLVPGTEWSSAGGVPTGPAAFTLGGHVWRLESGRSSLLRPAPIFRRSQTAVPRWSPTGDHLAVLEQAGSLTSSTTFVLVLIPRSGDHVRIGLSQAAARSFSWSPDGKEIAVVVDRRGVSGIASDAQLEVRFFDTAGRASRPAVPGNEVAWTAKGILVLREVNGVSQVQRADDAKTILARDRLASDPRIGGPVVSATMSGLDAVRDGTLASVQLRVSDGSASRLWSVVFDADGAARHFVRADTLTQLQWSPQQPLLGYTLDIRAPAERAVVHSVESGQVVAVHEGAQFAGWSADGRWYYVSRVTGLFAHPAAGGSAVRVGPAGAPLTATAAR